MDSVAISVPDPQTMRSSTNPVLVAANALEVRTQEHHQLGQEILHRIADAQRKVQEHYKNSKDLAFQTHRQICADEAKLLKPLTEARTIVSQKCARYEQEARERAEDERRELEAAEARKQAERALAAAQEAQDAGDGAAAEAILEAAVSDDPPRVVVKPEVAKVEGVSLRWNYTAEVHDLLSLVRHVANRPELLNLIKPNSTAINGLARAHKDNFKVAGCRLIKTPIHAVRTR